jgi:hypothetical protein
MSAAIDSIQFSSLWVKEQSQGFGQFCTIRNGNIEKGSHPLDNSSSIRDWSPWLWQGCNTKNKVLDAMIVKPRFANDAVVNADSIWRPVIPDIV